MQLLDLSDIPFLSVDRSEDDPIVIGGGPCTYNPEPIADFFDIFYMGEGETEYYHLIDLYKENKANGGQEESFLKKQQTYHVCMCLCFMMFLIMKMERLRK